MSRWRACSNDSRLMGSNLTGLAAASLSPCSRRSGATWRRLAGDEHAYDPWLTHAILDGDKWSAAPPLLAAKTAAGMRIVHLTPADAKASSAVPSSFPANADSIK